MNDFLNMDGSRGEKPEKRHGRADPLFLECTEQRFALVGVGVNRVLAAASAQDREAVVLAETPVTNPEASTAQTERPALSVVPDYAPPIDIDEARRGVEQAVTPDVETQAQDDLEEQFKKMGWDRDAA